MTTPAIPRLLVCGSYHPGHDVHWIQAKRSHEPPAVEGVASVGTDGWVTVYLDAGDSQRVWNHDPGRLAVLLARTAGRAVLRSHSVLAVPSADGHHCVSVASAPSPCPEPDENLGGLSLGELVLRRGGFSIPAGEAHRRRGGRHDAVLSVVDVGAKARSMSPTPLLRGVTRLPQPPRRNDLESTLPAIAAH